LLFLLRGLNKPRITKNVRLDNFLRFCAYFSALLRGLWKAEVEEVTAIVIFATPSPRISKRWSP
jgi:hypothetical protein